jgi:hypothetical protein
MSSSPITHACSQFNRSCSQAAVRLPVGIINRQPHAAHGPTATRYTKPLACVGSRDGHIHTPIPTPPCQALSDDGVMAHAPDGRRYTCRASCFNDRRTVAMRSSNRDQSMPQQNPSQVYVRCLFACEEAGGEGNTTHCLSRGMARGLQFVGLCYLRETP